MVKGPLDILKAGPSALWNLGFKDTDGKQVKITGYYRARRIKHREKQS